MLANWSPLPPTKDRWMLKSPTTLLNDPARLDALHLLNLLDTPVEEAFDRVTRIATRMLSVPISLVTFVDSDRQFFKSSCGLPEPWASERETPLTHSFCQYIVGSGQPLLVGDARLHPILQDNLAVPDLGVVAYAGVPLLAPDGQVLGALCAIDGNPHAWSEDEVATLHDLAEMVMLVMHQRQRTAYVVERWETSETTRREKEALLDRISDAFYALDRSWRFVHLNVHCNELLRRPSEELLGRCIWDEFPEAIDTMLYDEYHRALDCGRPAKFEFWYPPLDAWFSVHVYPAADGLSVYFRDVSELRQSEVTLSFLRDIVDASNDGIIGTDHAGRIISWNAAAERMYRRTAAEILGQPVLSLDPVNHAAEGQAIREAIDAGQTIRDVEMRLTHDDACFVDVSISVAPMFDVGGAIAGSSAIVRDVTEHRRTRDALRDAEQRYRTLVEHSPAVTYIEDVGVGIVHASPQVFELSGYTQDEIASRPGFWLDAVHPDDVERVVAEVQRANETFEPFAVDMLVFRKDGRQIWLHNCGVLHRDDAGVPQYWQGFLLDITDRVRAEEERARAADMLRAVIDASPLAIMATDAHGIVLMWNPTAERLFGWTSNEVLGKPVPLIPASSGDEAAQRLTSAMMGEQTHGYETKRQHKDGSLIDVSISSAPIRDASGATVGAMAMYLDIRERALANVRLQDAERMLRSLVEQSPGVLYRTLPDNLDIVTYISPQLETLTGWSVQEVLDIGDGWFDSGLHSDDIDLVRSAYSKRLRERRPVPYRIPAPHALW